MIKKAQKVAKIASIAVVLFALPTSAVVLHAIEVDFLLGNNSTLELGPATTSFAQQNTLGFGLRTPFSDGAELLVAGTGSFAVAEGGTPQFGLSLDQLLLSMEVLTDVGLASVQVGRLAVAEPTGVIANLPAEGVTVGLITPGTTLEFTAAYTGLPLGLGQTTREARWVATATLAFPELFARQSIITTLVGTTAAATPAGGTSDAFSGAYGSLVLTGPISTQSFYTAFGILLFADGPVDEVRREGLSGAAGLSLRHFFQDPWDTAILLNAALATGGDLPFRPLTHTALAKLLPAVFGNVVGMDVLFTTKPVSFGRSERLGVSPRLGLRVVARVDEGPGTVTGLDPGSAAGLLGVEGDLAVELRVSSDVRIGTSAILAIPTELPVTGGALPDTTPIARLGIDVELRF